MKAITLFLIPLLSLLSASVFAESLPLTAVEIQKLQHYFPTNDDATHLVWKSDPLQIQLPLNQEKRLVFPSSVIFDAKGAITTDQLRIINDNKSLYLTALKPINNTRVYITLQDIQDVLLIDLVTADKASNSTAYIDIQPRNVKQPITTTSINNDLNNLPASHDESTQDPISDNDNYVTLIRFAWQQLYAPERLLNNSLDITRVPMYTEPLLSTLVYGDKVIAHPMVSWTYNNKYVTAIELRNKYPHVATININRDLCGDWQAASIYPHRQLKPAGDKSGDSATLFVISAKPFGDSMVNCDVHA